jgi:hypothetical protein
MIWRWSERQVLGVPKETGNAFGSDSLEHLVQRILLGLESVLPHRGIAFLIYDFERPNSIVFAPLVRSISEK